MRKELLKGMRQKRRVKRVRKKVTGISDRPRLAVSRSNQHIYAQVIDDTSGRTLCAVGTMSKDMRTTTPAGGNVNAAAEIGKVIGQKARELGIEQVCFDRRGRRYHGRIKALADAAREAGLKF